MCFNEKSLTHFTQDDFIFTYQNDQCCQIASVHMHESLNPKLTQHKLLTYNYYWIEIVLCSVKKQTRKKVNFKAVWENKNPLAPVTNPWYITKIARPCGFCSHRWKPTLDIFRTSRKLTSNPRFNITFVAWKNMIYIRNYTSRFRRSSSATVIYS